MKILVFSDSHGQSIYIRRAMEMHRADTDMVWFLGDGVRDICDVLADFPSVPAVIVQGNCDSALAVSACGLVPSEEEMRTLDGVRILAMHGHTAGVKYGREALLARASEAGASLVLYGHTHTPENRNVRAPFGANEYIHFFNPGSVGQDPTHPYGVIYLLDGKISAAHGQA